jgi:hypothetical protein
LTLLPALLLAASGAALLPASADGALVVSSAAGIRAMLETAGRRAASLSPDALGGTLRDRVGVDLLAEQPQWALSTRGPRALVLMLGSVGLSAPVADAKAARLALDAWLRPSKGTATAGRAGMIASVAGSRRLLTASGRQAAALVNAMAHPMPFSRDKALLAHATGPAWLYLKGQPPLRAALFALDASAAGLTARGLVTPLRDPILAGGAPGPCAGSPPGCLRAGLGPSGRGVLSLVLEKVQKALPAADAVVVRLDGIDLQQLGGDRSLPRALRISCAAAEAQPGPALAGQIDLAAIDAALSQLTPLDALRGSVAASVYATHLLYGSLLRNAGPLTLRGVPSKSGAEIELRLPLR